MVRTADTGIVYRKAIDHAIYRYKLVMRDVIHMVSFCFNALSPCRLLHATVIYLNGCWRVPTNRSIFTVIHLEMPVTTANFNR